MPTISIIIPCHNGAPFLPQCLTGIEQMALFSPPALTLETCFFDDGSTDNSSDIVLEWQENLRSSSTDALRRLAEHVRLGCRLPEDLSGQGCGYAKNRAVRELSSGEFLLFQDADDISFAGRAVAQIEACCSNGSDNVNVNAGDSNPCCGGSGSVHTVVGCNFVREPAGATERYTAWANALDGEKDLWIQQYRECTIIMPSWFMRRATFDAVGGFADNWADALQRFGVAPRAEPGDVLAGPKVPEDLVFFHRLLDIGGVLRKVPDTLLMYRYHAGATSAGIHRLTLMDVRIRAFERRVLLQKQNLPDETTYSRLDSGDIQQESMSTGAGIAVASVAGAASMPLVAEVLPFSSSSGTIVGQIYDLGRRARWSQIFQ